MSKHLDIGKALPATFNNRRKLASRALVAVVTDGAEAAASTDLTQWKLANPLAAWIEIDIRKARQSSDGFWLRRKLSDLLDRQRMQFSQLVLIGRRDAGRLALNLVLDGTVACAGLVGVDIPCTPPLATVVPTAARIRLVLHEDDVNRTDSASLIDVLRREDIDTRVMMLPSLGADGVKATARAAEIFLIELVTKASWPAIDQRGS